MAARPDGAVYLSGAVLDAVCTPGLCKATNIGSYQDRCGRMLLSRYCARDAACAARLGGDPEHFAAGVFDSLDAGELPCAAALALRRPELQTLLGELANAHWPEMRLAMVAPLLRSGRHRPQPLHHARARGLGGGRAAPAGRLHRAGAQRGVQRHVAGLARRF